MHTGILRSPKLALRTVLFVFWFERKSANPCRQILEYKIAYVLCTFPFYVSKKASQCMQAHAGAKNGPKKDLLVGHFLLHLLLIPSEKSLHIPIDESKGTV